MGCTNSVGCQSDRGVDGRSSVASAAPVLWRSVGVAYLPVEEPRALFSCGDAHAAQGDGEVCVTGIEAPMERVELRFELQKGRRIPAPQFRTAGALTPRVDGAGWFGTTGIGPDLYHCAQDAVRAMVDHLAVEHGLSREDAYVVASLCVDLKISEVVDAGEWVVSALLPLAVFRS